jgi:Ca-activated chloride channel family protein
MKATPRRRSGHFSSEDAPVSLGVIFDSSGSMSSKMDRAKDAVMEFFKTANPQDEFFMITFSDEPEEVSDFTSSVDEIQNKLVYAVPRRRTALLDAIYMGVSKMRQAKYRRRRCSSSPTAATITAATPRTRSGRW